MFAIAHYFAYGSNMNPDRVSERGLSYTQVCGAQLPGYRLTFNKMSKQHQGEGHANIETHAEGHVEGALYSLVDEAEILKMDPFEHAPWNYGRDVVRVNTASGPVWAWTYFANPAVLAADVLPSRGYMAHLLAGEAFLSANYFAQLKTWPTV